MLVVSNVGTSKGCMTVVSVLATFFVLIGSPTADGLECYTCTNVTVLNECKQVSSCPDGSRCVINSTRVGETTRFTLGCTSTSNCPAPSTNTSTESVVVVGRSVTNTDSCTECCSSNNCNRQLCQHADAEVCKDATDCAAMGAIINVCMDTKHAKHSCKRFCGLCSMVDGGWTSWNQWSGCDVTCGNGTHTRTRQCENPAPANGGDGCVGKTQDIESCYKVVCPVPGGWSQWSPWGSCSSSCDIGLQRRDRSCSNPYPAHNGDHCYGDSRDDKLCFPGACEDGSWSVWGQWGACSISCGYGTRMRTRACDNPPPSLVGKTCAGDSSQLELCYTKACQAKLSAFTADNAVTHNGNKYIFNRIKINEGGHYNQSTGIFTCEQPGLYFFSVDLARIRYNDRKHEFINAYIDKNGQPISEIYIDYDDSAESIHGTSYSATGSAVVRLVKGDTVYVTNKTRYDVEKWSSFSGFLFHADP